MERVQGISINMVVLAAFILLVFLIPSSIFLKKTDFQEEFKSYCDRYPDDSYRCVCDSKENEMIFNHTHNGECTKARKKTIADLNCTELKDYFENRRRCEGVPPWRVCNYPKTEERSNVLYHIVRKDCT